MKRPVGRLSERQYTPADLPRQLQERDRELSAVLERINDRLPVYGEGSPEGIATAPVGTLYLRTDGGTSTTLYVKESGAGNTGWVAK